MESSCKDNYNVSDAFSALVEMTNNEFQKSNRNKNIALKKNLNDKNHSKKNSKCC